MDVIKPNERHVYTDTIMDVCPIATKVEGTIGEGITNIMDGVVFVLTGVDEEGVQIHEFSSSEGWLDEHMIADRAGNVDPDDIIIRVHAVVEKGTGMERRGPYAAHSAEDVIMQKVREVLKATGDAAASQEELVEVRKTGRPKVVLVKEIMGQGAMHDNVIYPYEPAGVDGGQMNVDLGNIPVMMTPNMVLDGAIHALTCIGPGSKEMTRHYFREPIVEDLVHDDELELVGVIFVGSPQVNSEKTYVSQLLATLRHRPVHRRLRHLPPHGHHRHPSLRRGWYVLHRDRRPGTRRSAGRRAPYRCRTRAHRLQRRRSQRPGDADGHPEGLSPVHRGVRSLRHDQDAPLHLLSPLRR